MSATTYARLVVEIDRTLQNAATIVSAFNHVGPDAAVGFDLAAVCAMVENESGGRMIWGADPWNPQAYPKGLALPSRLNEQPVVELDYHGYRWKRDQGYQPQGCGVAQLTSPDLQVQAEKAGGCWVPFYNCLIGFRFLRAVFRAHGSALAGFTAYNGSGPAAEAYGRRAVGQQAGWQDRFNAALRGAGGG